MLFILSEFIPKLLFDMSILKYYTLLGSYFILFSNYYKFYWLYPNLLVCIKNSKCSNLFGRYLINSKKLMNSLFTPALLYDNSSSNFFKFLGKYLIH